MKKKQLKTIGRIVSYILLAVTSIALITLVASLFILPVAPLVVSVTSFLILGGIFSGLSLYSICKPVETVPILAEEIGNQGQKYFNQYSSLSLFCYDFKVRSDEDKTELNAFESVGLN